MTAGDIVSMAWSNLDRRKGRTALTAAGVVIGVAALVLMISLGLGLQRQVLQLFQTDEALKVLEVTRLQGESGEKKKPPGRFSLGMDAQLVPITETDLQEMRAVPGVVLARPVLNLFLRIKVEGLERPVIFPVDGVVPEDEATYSRYLLHGTMWKSPDERSCLLPSVFKAQAKPAEMIGRKVTFGSPMAATKEPTELDEFTVVGIFDAERFGLRGRQILLPMGPALDLGERRGSMGFMAFKKGSYFSAEVKVADPKQADAVGAKLRAMGYEVVSAKDTIKQINLIFLILEGFMACIGAIGLVVSLFGIANTMAMAVLERTREIGIMKALGGRNRDIRGVFLAEAAAIGALGGIIGLAAGTLIGMLLNLVAHGMFDLPERVSLFHVSPWLAAGSVLFSIFVSVLAGFLPARRAARMEPVAALRYE